MRWKQLELLKNGFKALPVFTTMGGALFGYLEGHEMGHNIMAAMGGVTVQQPTDVLPWYEVWQNVGIGVAMGLTGGMALACFGIAATHHIPVEGDSPGRHRRGGGIGAFIPTRFKTYFKKSDVEDHDKSIHKTAVKYDKKRREEEAEVKEILEIGTEGMRAKKFGKKTIIQKPRGK